jgi:pimeloyl-ACP methyl ester carboxylesterase
MTPLFPRFRNLEARILALHCSASSPSQWDAYRPLLAGGCRLHAPALLGYEDGSSWPFGVGVSLRAEALQLLPLLATHGGPIDLVGHSYGGAVALQVAALWPERIRSVTVYEPVAFHLLRADAASAALADEVRQLAAAMAANVHANDPEAAAERFVDYWSGAGTWARLSARRRPALARSMPKVCAEFGALFGAEPAYDALQPTGPEVRVVVGTASPAPVHRVSELLRKRVPHASVQQVHGAGHMAPVSAPAELAAALFAGQAVAPLALAA